MTMTTADAVIAFRSHHATLSSELRTRAAAVISAVEMGQPYAGVHSTLEAYVVGELFPHADAEEQVFYRAAETGDTTALVRALIQEHAALRSLVGSMVQAPSGLMAAAMAYALQKLFEVHVRTENEVLLPALVQRGVDLGNLLEGMDAAIARRPR